MIEPVAAKPPSILIVEDESIIAMDLRQTLRGMGYIVQSVARSGKAAIAAATLKRPDVVLMDIRISGPMDGIETAEILQERFQTPIIYLTANSNESTRDRAGLTRPRGYLLKPVPDGELRSAIERALHEEETPGPALN